MDVVNPAEIETRSDLTAAIAELFERASKSYLAWSAEIGISNSTLHAIVNGSSLPRWGTLELILGACGETDIKEWRAAHTRVRLTGTGPPGLAGAVRVAEARPLLLGVHQPIQVPGCDSESMPAYVLRDVDLDKEDGIRAAIVAASHLGGFILLLGGSSVGKTRCLYEAVCEVLNDWWLVHPSNAAEIQTLAGQPVDRLVVWLDELQRYLDRKDGLTAAIVRSLLQGGRGIVLAATVSADRYDAYTLLDAQDAFLVEQELLRMARIFHLDAALTTAEQDRARELAPTDGRVRAALEVQDYGFTQTLAGAPQLVKHWRSADPYGKALLTAAVDAASLGAQNALSPELLRSAVPGYCTNTERATAPADWFDRSLAYATARLHGSVSALVPQPGNDTDMGHIVGYTAAEYLQQHAGRSRRSASVPASLWLSCREFLTSPRDLRAMALSALSRWLFTESELLYRRLSAVTGAPLDLMLTALMARQHRLDELRSLAESGDVNASAQLHLFTNDEHDEAPDEQDETPPVEDQHQVGGQEEPAGMEGAFKETIIRLRALHENELRDRATTGDGRAMRELATLLTRQGRESELRARADTDDPFAARALADLLAHHGREQELRDRIAAGDLAAGEGLLALLRLRHREAEADRLYLYGLLPDGSIATGPP